MLQKFLTYLVVSPFKKFIWKRWYNLLTSTLIDKQITFMNYGYVDLSPDVKLLELNADDRREIYCAQLYHYVANAVPLNGCDVLEVGCGRGGGSSYIMRYLQPKTMTGVDFSERNIAFCQKYHVIPQLQFCIGDAESLPFPDCSFDVVVNIESSHCYADIEKFFDEAFRVIRPNGQFLFADFRENNAIDDIRKFLEKSGFKIIKSELITQNVLKAMDLENDRKLSIINQEISKYFQTIASWFAGCQDTPIYEGLKNRDLEYFCYVLQKPPIQS
jgi:ubiquinone/menaquinone biosynthesis C-methylase UbiE